MATSQTNDDNPKQAVEVSSVRSSNREKWADHFKDKDNGHRQCINDKTGLDREITISHPCFVSWTAEESDLHWDLHLFENVSKGSEHSIRFRLCGPREDEPSTEAGSRQISAKPINNTLICANGRPIWTTNTFFNFAEEVAPETQPALWKLDRVVYKEARSNFEENREKGEMESLVDFIYKPMTEAEQIESRRSFHWSPPPPPSPRSRLNCAGRRVICDTIDVVLPYYDRR